MCVVNSCILYDLNNRLPLTSRGNRQLTFRRNSVLQLIGKYSSRKRTGKKKSFSTHPLSLQCTDLIQFSHATGGYKYLCKSMPKQSMFITSGFINQNIFTGLLAHMASFSQIGQYQTFPFLCSHPNSYTHQINTAAK
jgi:hypothetical protein